MITYSEKDIEETLLELEPDIFKVSEDVYIEHWLGSQVKVMSGIIDLYGSLNNGDLIVVELKKDDITNDALCQVMRYKADVELIMKEKGEDRKVYAAVAAPHVDCMNTFHSANAMGIIVFLLGIGLDIFARNVITCESIVDVVDSRAEAAKEMVKDRWWDTLKKRKNEQE